MSIGLGMEYDPSGAAAANADLERLKQAAASVQQPGGSSAAGGRANVSGEEALAKARQKTAEATEESAKAETELSKERTTAQTATTAAAKAEQRTLQQQEAAVQKSAQAQAQGKKAAEEAAVAEEKLRRAMELASKGRQELIKELQRLAKARQEAAKAGNVDEFERLSQQSAETREAFEKLNQGLELTNIQFTQQAQMGMAAGQTLAGLGQMAAGGADNFAGMAAQVLSLGQAIKVGLGPIGWAMMLLQGLQMAWDWYRDKQEAATKAERERMQAEQEALAKHFEAVRKFAGMDRDNALSQWKKELEEIKEFYEEFNAADDARAKKEDIRAAAAEERRKLAAQSAYDAEVARVELARTMGEMTEAEAAARKAAAEEVKAAEIQAAEEAAIVRENLRRREARDTAKHEAYALEAALKEKFGDFEEVLTFKLPTNEEWEALSGKLNEGLVSIEERQLSLAVHEKIREVKGLLADMGIAWKGSDTELLKWVNSMQEARELGEERVRELRALADAENDAATQMMLQLDQSKAEAEAEKQQRQATRQVEAARLQKLEQANNLATQWQEVQRGTLEEQAAWLEQTAASFAAGSEEAKRWLDALRGVKMRQVQEEINGLADKYRVTGNYAERDNRTQAQIHAADMQALQQRRAALQALKATPDLDAATLRTINSRIKETDRQTRGLRDAMHEAANAAQRAVAALQPLGQQAKNKGMQGSLRRAEKAFVALARQAERQAARGNTDAMERTLAAMRKNALSQEKMTGYTGRATAKYKEVANNLQHMAKGTAQIDRGLTAQQKQENAVRQELTGQRRYTARAAKSAAEVAAATAQEAAARKQAANQAQKDAQNTRPQQQVQQIADLTAQLNTANAALQQANSSILTLNSAINSMAQAASAAANAAAQGAQNAAARLANLQNQVNSLRAAVNNIRRS